MQALSASRTKNETKLRTRFQSGWHDIGKKRVYLRSSWELSYAKYLEWLKNNKQIKEWIYEPITFYFEGIKRGTNNYKPDFCVHELNGTYTYIEIKGYMSPKDRTKFKRMAKYHPNIKLIVIDAPAFRKLKAQLGAISGHW